MYELDYYTKEEIKKIFIGAQFDNEGDPEGTWVRTDQWQVSACELFKFRLLPLEIQSIIISGSITFIVLPRK